MFINPILYVRAHLLQCTYTPQLSPAIALILYNITPATTHQHLHFIHYTTTSPHTFNALYASPHLLFFPIILSVFSVLLLLFVMHTIMCVTASRITLPTPVYVHSPPLPLYLHLNYFLAYLPLDTQRIRIPTSTRLIFCICICLSQALIHHHLILHCLSLSSLSLSTQQF
jgi:hypothetical protein